MRAIGRAIFIALVGFAVFSSSAEARIPTRAKAVAPVYNPETKSYFELRIDNDGRSRHWNAAKRMALGNFYKGVRGRLAIVRTAKTMDLPRDSDANHPPGDWSNCNDRCPK